MTDQIVRDRPDTHDMYVVHRVFRRETALLPRLVRSVRAGRHRTRQRSSPPTSATTRSACTTITPPRTS